MQTVLLAVPRQILYGDILPFVGRKERVMLDSANCNKAFRKEAKGKLDPDLHSFVRHNLLFGFIVNYEMGFYSVSCLTI